MTHALFTGAGITGRIPHGDKWLDVTPDVLTFDTPEEAQAAADSIEAELHTRGVHPVQTECAVLSQHGDEFPDEAVKAHQSAHKALNKKMGV